MSFVHPLLLAGLALAGLPVLIHLIMRQKPKRLPFPAFRFLAQKHRTNQTRLRLRHLLLLLLRMAVIAALCLALARPSLTGGALGSLAPDRPVSAVLLIDTSYSMEYAADGKTTRLDDARRRAGELLDDLPEGSQVAVLDSAEVGGRPESVARARDHIAGLKLRHDNAPLTRQIERAYGLFADLDRAQEGGAEAPHLLYVISDRTRGCWDEAAAAGLKAPPGLTSVFVDVGVDAPSDLAVVSVQAEPATVRHGGTVRVSVTLRATGADYPAELVCTLDARPEGQKRSRTIRAGQSEVVTFEYRAAGGDAAEVPDLLAEGPHQVSVQVLNSDPLKFDNVGFATFRVLGARPLLVTADDKAAGQDWAGVVSDEFTATVKTPKELAPGPLDLDDYAAVCLFNVARPEGALWAQLGKYVADGHGLMVVLGGATGGPDLAAYNDDNAAAELMPVRLEGVQKVAGAARYWSEFQDGGRATSHPLMAPFLEWKRGGAIEFFVDPGKLPRADRFWKVRPQGQADVLAHFADADESPALVERAVARGRVLVLTTALDTPAAPARWNNYMPPLNSFGFVLSHMMLRHLAGDNAEPTVNYVTGQAVTVPLPARPALPTYTLVGPGFVGGNTTLTRQPGQRELTITGATQPGNFLVLAVPDNNLPVQKLAAFSMNPRPEEHILDRVPVDQIEALLGSGSVLPVGQRANLRERLQERGGRPLELMPWLLIALLVFLAVESLLANRFYRQPAPEEPARPGEPPPPQAVLRTAAKQVEEAL